MLRNEVLVEVGFVRICLIIMIILVMIFGMIFIVIVKGLGIEMRVLMV